MHITTIGLDLAKHWFQIHGVDTAGKVAVKRRLRRTEVSAFFRAQEPCLVGMEACATAHHWARELIALGHEVKLMPPACVKAYVKRNKNDAADAEAICEAAGQREHGFLWRPALGGTRHMHAAIKYRDERRPRPARQGSVRPQRRVRDRRSIGGTNMRLIVRRVEISTMKDG
jgi:transposase